MRLPLLLIATGLYALATPLAAQEVPSTPIASMADDMRDPDKQREVAMLAQTMTEILLDMPIAPLAQAAAEMAGERAQRIDPDLTLRKLAPQAGELSAQVGRNAPRAMQAAGTLAGAVAVMAPALRSMAEQMSRALPRTK